MRKYPRLLSLAGGLAALFGGITAQAQTTNLLSLTTFDSEAPSPWGYGYFYADSGLGLQSYQTAYYLPDDLDLTNAMWQFTFDLSSLVDMGGYGTGTGGPIFRTDPDPASFVSPERGNYIFTFDARVEGLDPAQTSANGEMQAQFYYTEVVEEVSSTVKSLQVNLPFAPTAEWQTFRFTLEEGSLGDNTSDAVFAEQHANTSEVRFNVNFHEPHSRFGYDWDNVLYLDNIKLEVVDKPSLPPVEKFPVTMAEWNFDDLTVWSEWHYAWSQTTVNPIVIGDNNANGAAPNSDGVDGSSAWVISMDNSEFAWEPPQWAGGGSGGNGPLDYSLFDSSDLTDYQVTFQARVEGLAPGRDSSSGVLQLHLSAPDDTLTPADEDAEGDFIVRLDIPIAQVGADWKTYTTLLSKAGAGGGSKQNFIDHHAAVSGMNTQWQIENAQSVGDWDYDADNKLIIDNFKLERLYLELPAPAITLARNGAELVLTWTGENTKLQSAATIDGAFADVEGAVSGHTVSTSGNAQFFRLVQQ